MGALPSHLLTSHHSGYKKGSMNCDCTFITRNIYIYLEITWKWILCLSLPKSYCRELLNLLVYKKGSISMAKMRFSLSLPPVCFGFPCYLSSPCWFLCPHYLLPLPSLVQSLLAKIPVPSHTLLHDLFWHLPLIYCQHQNLLRVFSKLIFCLSHRRN